MSVAGHSAGLMGGGPAVIQGVSEFILAAGLGTGLSFYGVWTLS